MFEDGTAEEWCEWRSSYDNLVLMHGYKNHADQKMTLAYALLKCKARDISVSTKNGIAAKNDL